MRVPSRNKVERFPRREGNKVICDRELTQDEIEARREEGAALRAARENRLKKAREQSGR